MKRGLAGMLLVLVACTGGGDGSGCEQVSPVVLDAIAAGLTVDGGTLRDGLAVQSADDLQVAGQDVWFVAAEIDGPGIEGDGEVGVWATNKDPSLDADVGRLMFAVNSLAQKFSDWGADVQETPLVQAMMDDAAVEEALGCAGA